MNAQQLTPLVEAQAIAIAGLEARIAELEASRERMLVWAEKVQAHIAYLEGKAKPAKTEWKSGPRPSHPVRRPAAPAAAAAELPPEPEQAASPGIEWKDLPVEDCPF
jgi:hypothetical protein